MTATAQQPDSRIRNLLSGILNMLMSPLGYDGALKRYRQTAIVEVLPTLANVTTLGTCGSLTNVVSIGGDQAQLLTRGANLSAWALTQRNRIT